jgi:hypothetical protein
MSARRTAMLAATLLVLAAYFAIFEGFSNERAAPEWQRGEKIVDCRSGPPRELSVTTSEGTVAARLVHDRWETDAGGLAPIAFGALAETVCRLPIIDHMPAGEKLVDFGLDPPQAKIAIGLGRKRELWLGASTPADNLLYAKFVDAPDVLKIGVELKSTVARVAGYAKGATS